MNRLGRLLALAALCLAALPARAQGGPPIKIVCIAELSGGGASTGTNLKNGVELAAKEINAGGGILGRKVEVVTYDTQTTPSVAKALAQKAVDEGAYVVVGPVFSGSTIVSMIETRRAEIPNFTASEAVNITTQGNPYIFRTSFTQKIAMPKVSRYIKDEVKAKSVAVVWVNDDFGKGGKDEILKAFQADGLKVPLDLSTDANQIDFAGVVLKVKQSGADALFVYLHEEESARFLRELRKQGYDKPIVGETTIVNQKVIELAGDAANGVRGHVGLTIDAPIPAVKAYNENFFRETKFRSDHNGMKGYFSMWVIKAVTEKVGKVDSKAFAKAMKGVSLSAKQYPGLFMDVTFDNNGDLDRESFLVEVRNGKQEVIKTLPALGAPTKAASK